MLAVAVLTLGLSSCTAGGTPAPAPPPSSEQQDLGPCGADVAGRQARTPLRPDTRPVGAAALRGSGVRAFLVPEVDGVCLVLDPGTVPFGWQVDARRLSAGAGGRTWSWEAAEGDGVGALVVPRSGCVEVAATVRLSGPGGVAGAWSLAQPYGWGCARAPGGAAPTR